MIGAGLAGGLVAYELARRGISVVVLEAGPRYDPRDRPAALARLMEAGERPWKLEADRDGFTNAGPVAYPLNDFRVKGVGGTTLHWTAYAVRLHETDFRMRELYGIGDDWPIRYADLEPWYGLAEESLGVAGVGDNPFASARSKPYPLPPFPPSYADRVLTRGCTALDIRVHGAPFARNSVAYQGRPICEAYGVCASHNICPIHAQYTAEVHLDLAVQSGRVTVRPDAPVLRINTDAGGRVRSVLYAGSGGAIVEQRARHFVLAAHAVESARLLLLSETTRFPHGLANGSGMVGRNFMEHPFWYATGRIRENVAPYRIGFHTTETHQFCSPEGRADEGAHRIAFLNQVGPKPATLALESGLWGDALAKEVRENFGHQVGMHAFVEQLPDARNTVTLDPRMRDRFGNAVPRLTYDIRNYERDAGRRARQTMRRILEASGAHEIDLHEGEPQRFCGHQIGTCRMGRDPARSVVNADLRAHDVDNLSIVGSGAFVTAGPLNPSLTIAALAIRLGRTLTP